MVTVRYAAGMLAVLCWAITFVTLTVSGVTVAATLLFVVWLWTFGVFTRGFWVGDAETSARLAEVDDQIDFAESVASDIASISRERDPRV